MLIKRQVTFSKKSDAAVMAGGVGVGTAGAYVLKNADKAKELQRLDGAKALAGGAKGLKEKASILGKELATNKVVRGKALKYGGSALTAAGAIKAVNRHFDKKK